MFYSVCNWIDVLYCLCKFSVLFYYKPFVLFKKCERMASNYANFISAKVV